MPGSAEAALCPHSRRQPAKCVPRRIIDLQGKGGGEGGGGKKKKKREQSVTRIENYLVRLGMHTLLLFRDRNVVAGLTGGGVGPSTIDPTYQGRVHLGGCYQPKMPCSLFYQDARQGFSNSTLALCCPCSEAT